jgi:hypothetical protein
MKRAKLDNLTEKYRNFALKYIDDRLAELEIDDIMVEVYTKQILNECGNQRKMSHVFSPDLVDHCIYFGIVMASYPLPPMEFRQKRSKNFRLKTLRWLNSDILGALGYKKKKFPYAEYGMRIAKIFKLHETTELKFYEVLSKVIKSFKKINKPMSVPIVLASLYLASELSDPIPDRISQRKISRMKMFKISRTGVRQNARTIKKILGDEYEWAKKWED